MNPWPETNAERIAAVAELQKRGMSRRAIGTHFGKGASTIDRYASVNGQPPVAATVVQKSASGWPDEDVALLRRLHDEGASDHEMAERIGRPRNAIIGKRFRMGLTRAESAGEPIPFRPKPNPKPAPKPRPRPVAARIPEPVWTGDGPTILQVRDSQCKWIEDKVASKDSAMCGAPAVPGQSWCAHHKQRVFVSPTRSKAVTSGREKGIVSAVASGHSIRTVAERYRRSIEDVISILESAA